MRYYTRIGPAWIGGALALLGAWVLVRQLLGLGPWFLAGTLGVAAAAFAVAWLLTGRLAHLTWACLSAAWAAYVMVGIYTGPLPFAFFPAFLGLGFAGVYLLGTRPVRWPLVPAMLLIGLGGVLMVITLGLAWAPYWVPVLLVLYGVWLLAGRFRAPG